MCGYCGVFGGYRAWLLLGAIFLFTLPMTPRLSRAGDWPQILGPARDGRATGESLLTQWPSGGPPQVWTYKVGSGFAGPAVAGSRVVVFHRVGENERVEALDAETGRSLWQTDFPALYRGGINPDTGPRCVPVIYQDNVYVFGAAGDLHSVALVTGAKRWSRNTYADFNGDEGYFGTGSTPIVADDKLLVNVGGRGGAGLVAFALDTGKTVWQGTDERASYSSPTTTSINGQQHVIFVTRLNTVAVDPSNGKVRFQFPFGRTGPTVNAATPLVFDGHLFVTASYGIGAELARISGGQPVTMWSSDDVLSSQYTTSVYDGGYLYGIDGREDIGTARLRCVEAKTGKVKWTEEDFGVAHMILADGKLLILKIDGQLVLAEASSAQYVELASARVSSQLTRSLPALSDGRLYVRNNPTNSTGELKCLVVGKR